MTLSFRPARDQDANDLADLRMRAMRPSLEAVGRFDSARARNRFLTTFITADTTLILVQNERAGLFVLRRRPQELYLDHLYIDQRYQGRKIGQQVIERLKDEARAACLPIRLMALKGSPANQFYLSCGFTFVTEDAFDTSYEWWPEPRQ